METDYAPTARAAVWRGQNAAGDHPMTDEALALFRRLIGDGQTDIRTRCGSDGSNIARGCDGSEGKHHEMAS